MAAWNMTGLGAAWVTASITPGHRRAFDNPLKTYPWNFYICLRITAIRKANIIFYLLLSAGWKLAECGVPTPVKYACVVPVNAHSDQQKVPPPIRLYTAWCPACIGQRITTHRMLKKTTSGLLHYNLFPTSAFTSVEPTWNVFLYFVREDVFLMRWQCCYGGTPSIGDVDAMLWLLQWWWRDLCLCIVHLGSVPGCGQVVVSHMLLYWQCPVAQCRMWCRRLFMLSFQQSLLFNRILWKFWDDWLYFSKTVSAFFTWKNPCGFLRQSYGD